VSWSLNIELITEADDVAELVEAAQASPAPDSDAANEQVALAKAAIVSLIDAVGGLPVNASAHGHANEDHAPRAGWSNDVVTVTVVSEKRLT
jgi:hypothetical protein